MGRQRKAVLFLLSRASDERQKSPRSISKRLGGAPGDKKSGIVLAVRLGRRRN